MAATQSGRSREDPTRSGRAFERPHEERVIDELVRASEHYVGRLGRLPEAIRAALPRERSHGDRGRVRPSLRWIDECHDVLEARLARGGADVHPEDLSDLRATKARLDDLRERIVAGHVGFVARLVQEMTLREYPDPDLVQEGVLGLLEALERFDHTRGFRFMTYAFWWVRRSVGRYWGNRDRVVHLSESALRRSSAARRARRELSRALGREPDVEELARHIEITPEQVRHRLDATRGALSIEGDEPDRPSAIERTLADERGPDPFERVASAQTLDELHGGLARLRERERRVLRLRFGLDGSPPLTLREAGEQMGLSRERVRQVELQALDRLRRLLGYRDAGAGRCGSS